MSYSDFTLHKTMDGEVYGASVVAGASRYYAITNGKGVYNVCRAGLGLGMGPMFTTLRGVLTPEAILGVVSAYQEPLK